MFVRKKANKSGKISVQVIDKSTSKYKVLKTIGSSHDKQKVEDFVTQGKQYIKEVTGFQELDFNDYDKLYP